MHVLSDCAPNPTQPAPAARPVDTEPNVEVNEEAQVNTQLISPSGQWAIPIPSSYMSNLTNILAMSSGDLAASHSSSPRSSITGRSRSEECMDPSQPAIQIPLPPSEASSVRENGPMNVREAAPSPPKLTENAEEDEKRELAELFLQEVAWRDPYIPDPYIKPIELTENVDEGKKPTRTESWERMLKEVSRHDEDMVKGWRDDIDTLLVFAGLFSAVVTAFAIESYQWLDKDPADTTVALLTQLISVQINGSQTTTSFEPTQFKPDASSIRINIFWFLSLILSLASALFGLLCKQWVREHQRDTTTRTSGEALALRQLRRDSFEKWGVSSFLSALPILLEVAPLFFFVGVLDLLWNRHPVPFAICFVAVSLSVGLYFLTTLLPTLTAPRDQMDDIRNEHFNRLSYQFICPYKSPQAWLVYRLSSALLRPLLRIPAINNFLCEKAQRFWVRQFDQYVPLPYIGRPFGLNVYELRAFEWAVTMFRDSPSMIPHLQNVLETIPPSVAASAVLDRWDHTMWKTVSMHDVERVLRYSDLFSFVSPNPTIPHPVLQHPEGISLLFHHHTQIYNVLLASVSSSDYFAPIPEPWQNDPPTLPDLDHVRYSIETKQDVQVDYNQVLDVLTSNGVGDAFGVGPSEGVPIQHPQNFSAHNVDINVNALLGTRSVDNMIRVHGFEVNGTGRPTGNQENFNAGGDGSRIHQDNTQGDTMKGLDSAKQINTGMLGDSTGELSDITGDSYSLRSLGRHMSNT
uniref:DUF6535 domain-containing protein n=1 Tax=Moniliophthora roreri TaxID=221103 RepID=A0A0W0FHX2_MONRR